MGDRSERALDVGTAEVERELARANLAKQFGISSAFVRVSLLRRVLGIGGSSIYAQMKAGTFPMPHRKVGNVVVVKFDDLLNWYVRSPEDLAAVAAPSVLSPRRTGLSAGPEKGGSVAEVTDDLAPLTVIARSETAKERAARIKSEAHAAVRKRMRHR